MKRQSRAIFVVLRVGKAHSKKFLLFSKGLGFLEKAIGLGAFLQPWLPWAHQSWCCRQCPRLRVALRNLSCSVSLRAEGMLWWCKGEGSRYHITVHPVLRKSKYWLWLWHISALSTKSTAGWSWRWLLLTHTEGFLALTALTCVFFVATI